MASGRTHEAINLGVFAALAGGYAYARARSLADPTNLLFASETLWAFVLSYLIGTFLITPDLDLAENRMRARNNWGLLGLLWVPYGVLFSHRGLSHTWLVGPLTRLVYLVLLALALGWAASEVAPLFGYRVGFEAEVGESWPQLLVGMLAGYYLSQWLHLIADGIQPDHAWKRKRGRPKGRKRYRRSS
jgi:uncharacterized metal-binding protein